MKASMFEYRSSAHRMLTNGRHNWAETDEVIVDDMVRIITESIRSIDDFKWYITLDFRSPVSNRYVDVQVTDARINLLFPEAAARATAEAEAAAKAGEAKVASETTIGKI